MRIKPRVLVDLKSSSLHFPRLGNQRINLGHPKIIRLHISSFVKFISMAAVLSYLFFGSALAPIEKQTSLAAQNQEERARLEKQLTELENQIEEYQGTIDTYKSQGKNLESEIKRINAKISQLNLKIKSITLTLEKLDDEIDLTKNKLVKTENEIDTNKLVLSSLIQKIYENENLGILEVMLKKPKLSDFFSDITDLMSVQASLRKTLENVMDLKIELIDQKEQLALQRSDAAALKAYQDSQKQSILNTKQDKNTLLQKTKGQESKYQALLKETQKTASQIRSRIFEFLGGGELTFEEAYKFARFAEKETGIRAALLLAVLDRESALGSNVGRCPYYDPAKDKYYMHPTRDVPIFLSIVEELKKKGDAPPEPILVSCPNRDGTYGGAMGPAQFIPSTWKLYAASIADITGSNPPSPWRNADAFIGTALYLKDAYASQACRSYANENSHISPKQLLQERCATAKYYAGGRWYTYRWAYGQPTLDRANSFESDIAILNG